MVKIDCKKKCFHNLQREVIESQLYYQHITSASRYLGMKTVSNFYYITLVSSLP